MSLPQCWCGRSGYTSPIEYDNPLSECECYVCIRCYLDLYEIAERRYLGLESDEVPIPCVRCGYDLSAWMMAVCTEETEHLSRKSSANTMSYEDLPRCGNTPDSDETVIVHYPTPNIHDDQRLHLSNHD